MRRPLAASSLIAAVLLSACASAPADPAVGPTNPLARTPLEQYSAGFTDAPDEILLAPSGGLSETQAAALGELVMRWRDDGGQGPIVVAAAAAGPARDTAAAAAQALVGFGVPSTAVQLASAEPAGPEVEPVRVGFTRLVAVLPDCSNRWGELTRTKDNTVHAGFGCAMASNMAAMAANPRDLLHPRAGGAADGDRRADVIDKYRKGQPTASQRGGDERGTLSNAIQ